MRTVMRVQLVIATYESGLVVPELSPTEGIAVSLGYHLPCRGARDLLPDLVRCLVDALEPEPTKGE
jgi:hypothetical protein